MTDTTPRPGLPGLSGLPGLRLDHLVLTVRDIEASCRFYCEGLGMERIVFGEGRIALRFGAQKINLHEAGRALHPHAAQPLPGSADLCLLTELDTPALQAHLQDRGITLETGPVNRTGATGPIRSFYVRDPDGNLIELATPVHEPDKASPTVPPQAKPERMNRRN